jgi:nucleotide-binding universal stress UspA family protein
MTDLPIRHVLFPYDFSAQGRQVLPFVSALARAFGAHVTVLSVETFDHKQELQCRLDRESLDELAGLEVERKADSGDPALRIADFAHRHDVDLVMMPTHGLGLFRAVLVGSVTSKVLHDVRCPVWTAAHADTQHAPVTPQTILCAVDAKTEGVKVLQYAALLSRRVGATLTVLHVVEPMSDWPELARERTLQEEARNTATQAVASMLAAAGVTAQSSVVSGEIVGKAVEAAREMRAGLMVVGRGAIGEPFGRIRTHAFGLIEQAPCPVLSV